MPVSTASSAVVGAGRLATLLGDFDRSPAYAGIARTLQRLLGEGRVPPEARLPSERDLSVALGVSRTTVTRAYAALVDGGWAQARVGAGTFTRLPGGSRRAADSALLPYDGDADAVDLSCAAASAPPGLAAVYQRALEDLPAHLGGHGYFPAGLPVLQEAIAAGYAARGLPTAPDQIMVTPGALTATAVVAAACSGPGDRVLVEDPVYPNATHAMRHAGARAVPVPVDPQGWDLDAVEDALRGVHPRLAYLIPDFQNPTGHVMTAEQRERYAAALRAAGTIAVVDEAHQALALDGQEMPPPFAAFAPRTVTIGSASKSFWGGLRLGWVRAEPGLLERITRARVALDLGTPVLEQLVLARLLTEGADVAAEHRARLREQRDHLVAGLREHLPSWRFVVPTGGLALWCELPADGPAAHALVAEAERHGVILTAGPVFAVDGGLGRFVRIPWAQPVEALDDACRRLAAAWDAVTAAEAGRVPRHRTFVA